MITDGARRLPSERDTGGAGLHRHVGTSRVFGIDEVCGETLPDGSLRAADCPERNDAAPSSAAGRTFRNTSQSSPRGRGVEGESRRCRWTPCRRALSARRATDLAKIVQNAREVVFFTTMPSGSFYRIIPIDGRKHRTGISSSYLGDAVGRIEGDTLVVETVNVTGQT